MSVVAPAPAAPSRPRRAAPATETAPKRRQNRRRPATLARPRAGRSPVAPGVLWVLLIAVLLGGIVALNVGALRNSISASKIEGQEAALRSQNDELRSVVAEQSGLGRINAYAARYGMISAQPLRNDYLRLHPLKHTPKAATANDQRAGRTSRAAKRRREQAVRPAVAADHVRVRSRVRGRDRARAVRADPAGQRPRRPRPRPAELDHRGAHQPRPDPRRDRQDAGRRRAREGSDGRPVQGAGPRPGRLLHRPEARLPDQAQEGVQEGGALPGGSPDGAARGAGGRAVAARPRRRRRDHVGAPARPVHARLRTPRLPVRQAGLAADRLRRLQQQRHARRRHRE